MSSPQQIPPWLQEQIRQFQQTQQNLQVVQIQRQQLDAERADSEKALEELKKAGDEQAVYKQAGSVLVKSDRASLVDEVEERKTLAVTRAKVLSKQEERLKESLAEQEARIKSALTGGGPAPAGAAIAAPPPPPAGPAS